MRSDNEGERDASMTKESARDGTQVTWAIGRIMQGERIEVLYTIQGDPEAEYKVSDAQDFHGATFGDEVDEEPNVPQWLDVPEEPTPLPSKETLDVPIEETEKSPDDHDEPEDNEGSVEEDEAAEETPEIDSSEEGGEENSRLCPACGFKVDQGSSICIVCGNTLS